jgi:hypothetical protein
VGFPIEIRFPAKRNIALVETLSLLEGVIMSSLKEVIEHVAALNDLASSTSPDNNVMQEAITKSSLKELVGALDANALQKAFEQGVQVGAEVAGCIPFDFILLGQVGIRGQLCFAEKRADITIKAFFFERTYNIDLSKGEFCDKFSAPFNIWSFEYCFLLKDRCLRTHGALTVTGKRFPWDTQLLCV